MFLGRGGFYIAGNPILETDQVLEKLQAEQEWWGRQFGGM